MGAIKENIGINVFLTNDERAFICASLLAVNTIFKHEHDAAKKIKQANNIIEKLIKD